MQNYEPPQDTPYHWMDPSEEERILQSMAAKKERMEQFMIERMEKCMASRAHWMDPLDQAISSTSHYWPNPPPQSSLTQQLVEEETGNKVKVALLLSKVGEVPGAMLHYSYVIKHEIR